MPVSRRHWSVAFAAALLAHGLIAVALFWQQRDASARAPGFGGIEVSLGAVGGAPGGGAVANPAVDEAAAVDPADAQTEETAEDAAEPETATDEMAEVTPIESVTAVETETVDSPVTPETPVQPTPMETVTAVDPLEQAVRETVETPVQDIPPVTETTARQVEQPVAEPAPPETRLLPVDPAKLTQPPEDLSTPQMVDAEPTPASDETAEVEVVRAMEDIIPETPIAEPDKILPTADAETRPPEPVAETRPREVAVAETVSFPTPPRKPEVAEAEPVDAPPPVAETVVTPPPAPTAAAQTSVVAIAPPEATTAQVAALSGARAGSDSVLEGDAGGAASATAGGVPGDQADYLATLKAWLDRHKEYPRRARLRRMEGTAVLRFVMDRSGAVLTYQLEETSGHSLLDREVVAMIERAQPLPQIPDDMSRGQLELVVPIQFDLR